MLAISSLSTYGIILGGWASNNKYSTYGAIRSCAQFISYEVPLGLSILGVIAATGSLNIEKIVAAQAGGLLNWNVFWQPLALLIFFTSSLAETNRLPFDLPECEQELIGGFHTEYSGIKFVLFFLAEYTHVVTVCFLTALLFLGGWHFPGLPAPVGGSLTGTLLGLLVLLVKVSFVLLLIMLLRWALPRFRFDQLMSLAWKGLVPMALVNLVGVALVLGLGLSKYFLTLTALLPILAAAYSAAKFNATMSQRRLSPAVQTSR
jgi:NADH-quinone oxidoreductase subunit H